MREAKAASALDHPNICTIHEIGETEGGRLYIAMTCYDGETLKKKVARGALPIEEAVEYAVQMARGLERAHEAGIIHRDVKPANVMVTTRGRVKILDFGLAKVQDVGLTKTGARLGTAAYMSPEQARGEAVDHRTDLWSLGVVLYEMLTGQRPFKGDYAQAVIYSILHETPPPLTEQRPDLPSDLNHIVGLCVEKERSLRYPSMADLLTDLEVYSQEEAVTHPSAGRAVLVAAMSVFLTLLVLLAITPVRQAAVGMLGISNGPPPLHLAVLPFERASEDDRLKDFCDGLVEIVTGQLAQLERSTRGSFWVLPATEVRRRGLSSIEEAREIGATRVITGLCSQHEGQMRIHH